MKWGKNEFWPIRAVPLKFEGGCIFLLIYFARPLFLMPTFVISVKYSRFFTIPICHLVYYIRIVHKTKIVRSQICGTPQQLLRGSKNIPPAFPDALRAIECQKNSVDPKIVFDPHLSV